MTPEKTIPFVIWLCIYIFFFILVALPDILHAINQRVNARHKEQTNARCNSILAKVNKTEQQIAQDKAAVLMTVPEEHWPELLNGYDEIENKLQMIRADVDRIRQALK